MADVKPLDPEILQFSFQDDGTIPNNDKFALIVFKQAMDVSTQDLASQFETLFRDNGWSGSWRNGIYGFHHYHSNTHEVLGCYSGSAQVQFGGPAGETLEFATGDVVIIPAGVAHKKLSSSADFAVVGAYPEGRRWDMNYGKPEEHDAALETIKHVELPNADPVYGPNGPLIQIWKQSQE